MIAVRVVRTENISVCKILRLALVRAKLCTRLYCSVQILTLTELALPAKHFSCTLTHVFSSSPQPWQIATIILPPFYRWENWGLTSCYDLAQVIEQVVYNKAWTGIRFVLSQSSHGTVSPVKNKPLSSMAKKLDSFKVGETGKMLLLLFLFKEQKSLDF